MRVYSDTSDYSAFRAKAVVNLGHSAFVAENADLHFSAASVFTTALSRFVREQTSAARLEGTHDTFLEFSRKGKQVKLVLRIGNALVHEETHSYGLTGSSGVDEDYFSALVPHFIDMLH